MPQYACDLSRTADGAKSVGSLVSGATLKRIRLFRLIFGCYGAPADNIFRWVLGRVTAAGTSTPVVPVALNPADPACTTLAGANHTVEPTYTAAQSLLTVPLHQRATFHLELAPGRELVSPATAANGFGLLTPTMTALLVNAHVEFNE